MADELKKKIGSGVVALVATNDGKASIVVAVTDDLTGSVNASGERQVMLGQHTSKTRKRRLRRSLRVIGPSLHSRYPCDRRQ